MEFLKRIAFLQFTCISQFFGSLVPETITQNTNYDLKIFHLFQTTLKSHRYYTNAAYKFGLLLWPKFRETGMLWNGEGSSQEIAKTAYTLLTKSCYVLQFGNINSNLTSSPFQQIRL